MKNRILALALSLVLLLSAVPFVAAAADGVVADCFKLSLDNRSYVVLTLAARYLAPTDDCTITLRYLESSEEPQNTVEVVADAAVLDVRQIAFEENGAAGTRLQCYVPVDRPNLIRAVEIEAGSFVCADLTVNPQTTLGEPPLLQTSDVVKRFSRVMQADAWLSDPIGVGEGDRIYLSRSLPVPVCVLLDGQQVASLAANAAAGTGFTVKGRGSHTLELRVMDRVLSQQTFTVVSQSQVYRNQLHLAWEDVAGMMLLPLAAPIATIIAPPAGIAAVLAPLLAGDSFGEFFRALFRVFNLMKK